MASWTIPTTHVTGDVLAVTDWNAVANNTTFLYQAPYASYYNSVATSIPNAVITQVTLGGTDFSGYGWSVSSNNAIVPITGIFAVLSSVGAGVITTGVQMITYIEQNGVVKANAVSSPGGAVNAQQPASKLVQCTAGDTLGIYGYQNTGGAVNSINSSAATYLSVFFVGSS